jgi:hypothetical protein
MKCPNEYCGGVVHEHVADDGSATRYCVDGCGYYEELPPGSRQKPKAPPPVARPKLKRKG